MARYRPGGQNRVRRRFKSASSRRRRRTVDVNSPAVQNKLMPGQTSIELGADIDWSIYIDIGDCIAAFGGRPALLSMCAKHVLHTN